MEKFNQYKYINEYKKQHYKRSSVELTMDEDKMLKSHLDITKESKNAFIKRAIFEQMKRDQCR